MERSSRVLIHFTHTWRVNGRLLAVMVVFNYENFPTNHWRIKCPLYVYPAVRGFMARCLHALHSGWSGVRRKTGYNVTALLNGTALSVMGIGPASRKATKRFWQVCRGNKDRSGCRDGLCHLTGDAFLLLGFFQVSLNSESHSARFRRAWNLF